MIGSGHKLTGPGAGGAIQQKRFPVDLQESKVPACKDWEGSTAAADGSAKPQDQFDKCVNKINKPTQTSRPLDQTSSLPVESPASKAPEDGGMTCVVACNHMFEALAAAVWKSRRGSNGSCSGPATCRRNPSCPFPAPFVLLLRAHMHPPPHLAAATAWPKACWIISTNQSNPASQWLRVWKTLDDTPLMEHTTTSH